MFVNFTLTPNFEYFKKRVSTNFILNDTQWEYIEEHWIETQSRLTKEYSLPISNEVSNSLQEAMDIITIAMLMDMKNGEDLKLNDEYHLYKYMDEDIYELRESETDDEDAIYQILFDKETDEILFESLT